MKVALSYTPPCLASEFFTPVLRLARSAFEFLYDFTGDAAVFVMNMAKSRDRNKKKGFTRSGRGRGTPAEKGRNTGDNNEQGPEHEEEDLDETAEENEEYYDSGEEYPEEDEEYESQEHPRRTRTTSEWSDPAGLGSDPDLVEGFLEGDEQAFNRLVMKYQHKVHNLCFRILGDRHEAQDMAQEVFMTMHKSLKDFRGDSLLSTWVYRIAVNHCKNRIKYLGRRRYYRSVSIDQPLDLDEGEAYFEPEDESPTPEEIMESQQLQELVQKAISTLDPDHRAAIVLRDIQHLSYEEIAETLGIKVGTVKSRIHRSRAELKHRLQQYLKKERTREKG